MASILPNWEHVCIAPDGKALLADFEFQVDGIRERLAAAPPDKAWRVALDIVDVERWPQKAGSMVAATLMQPGKVSTGAEMCISLVQGLSDLEECISVHYAALIRHKVRAASLATAPAQLQLPEGLLVALQQVFTQVQQQRQKGDQQSSSSSSCALGYGRDCLAALAPSNPTSATRMTGAGPPCRSCLLAHVELLAACNTVLRYWPECVLDQGPAVSAWVQAAVECALHMLQDVSTAILQHQQPHADGMEGPQQPTSLADVLLLGLAALDLLAAVCYAAAYPNPGDIFRLGDRQALCERGALDLPCMLPSMLAVGAAAVLGQEMQRRLCRTAATCADSGAGSAAAAAAAGAAVAGGGADLAAPPDATAPRDQSSQHSAPAGCSHGSISSKGAGDSDALPKEFGWDAVWQLVCVTEEWSGGQLLPQPLTLLLEALGCHPKGFLLLACSWQQHQHQRQQLASCGSKQQLQSQHSSQQGNPEELADICRGYKNVFFQERNYTCSNSSSLTASAPLLRRLSCCHAKGHHQAQHTQQHLLLALLLMREAVGRGARGMFQSANPTDAASNAREDRLGKCALKAASAAAACVRTWLCWAQFERQQQQEAREEPATAGAAAKAPIQPWALGGGSSSAVLLEVLQGHCLLLQEGVRELQAVTSSWAATRSSSGSDSDSGTRDPDEEVTPGEEVSNVDSSVAFILSDVLGLLRVLLAVAAVDTEVLQQAALHLFGLASTLEQLVRIRCACHFDRLLFDSDTPMLRVLQLLVRSQDLLTYAGLRPVTSMQHRSAAAAAAFNGLQLCGLLPYLALTAPLGGQQQRQLLGLLFSSLKLFSTYPTGLYAFSWSEDFQDDFLLAACDTIWAACAAGRLLLVAGAPGGWDAATRSPSGRQAATGSTSDSAGTDQRRGQDSTPPGGDSKGSSCHSCGLGAEGMAALVPWMVLQGRALQLWVALFRAYVQLPPAAEGSKAGAKGSGGQESHLPPHSLVGSGRALELVASTFESALAPNTQLLAVILQSAAFEGEQAVVERVQCWRLQRVNLSLRQPSARQQGILFGQLIYGVPGFLWPASQPAQGTWLQEQLAQRGQQLLGHCREQGLDLSRMAAASGSAAPAVHKALLTVMTTGDSMKQLVDNGETPHKSRLRQSDVRRYLKSWEVTDAAVLKRVLAMLSGGEHSAAGVAVAAWLCSPSIAGDLLAQLEEFSSQLSTLPIHEACNNPACRVTAGSREQGLVSGKACVCAGCRMGHYCSRACQREHWPMHQRQCGAVAGKREQ